MKTTIFLIKTYQKPIKKAKMSKFKRRIRSNSSNKSSKPTKPVSKSRRNKKKDVIALFTNNNGNNGNGINNHLNAGRKSKLTPRIQQMLIKAVSSNDMSIRRACMLCGITDPTFFNWKRAGETEKERIADEIQKSKDTAITTGMLDPLNPLAVEDFVEKELKKIKPNKFFNFFVGIKRAEAEAELANLEAIHSARDGREYTTEIHVLRDKDGNVTGEKEVKKHQVPQWTAAAWLLERKHPDLYGRRLTHDGNLDVNQEIKIGIAIIPEAASTQKWQEKFSPKDIDGKPRQIISEG